METLVAGQKLTRPGRILVVDDEEKNRSLLKDSLDAKGYDVEEATNGREALEKVASWPPDAILLDVMMPEMDGYETCRTLKRRSETAAIPILMITALNERDERLNGIKEGANDFLTKPIDIQDVLLRVQNAVIGKRMVDQLQQSNDKLQKLILRSDLTYLIIQELLSPLSSMMESLEQLNMSAGSRAESGEQRWITEARRGAVELERTIQFILDVARLEAGEMPVNPAPCAINDLVEEVAAEHPQGRVQLETAKERLSAKCDEQITRRVLSSLVHNAIKMSGNSAQVRLKTGKEGGHTRISVMDKASQIPAEYRSKVFSEFKKGGEHNQSHATGLSLTFCKLAIEAQRGRIGVDPNPGGGNIFWIELPAT